MRKWPNIKDFLSFLKIGLFNMFVNLKGTSQYKVEKMQMQERKSITF